MAEITVNNYSELKAAILDATSTYIYLGDNIVFNTGGGVVVPRTKGDITIDGQGFMITDYASGNSGDAIRFSTAAGANITYTVKNIVWNGRNYYGVTYVGESANCSGITLVLDNIDYTGPQAVHHRFGTTKIRDSRFSIEKNGSPSAIQELGEINRIHIEGRVVVHKIDANAVLWFLNPDPALIVEEGAEFVVNAVDSYMFYVDSTVPTMTFKTGSKTEIVTKLGMYLYNSSTHHLCESFTVEAGASFSSVQTTATGVPNFKCKSRFYMGEDSSLLIASPPATTTPLMYFANAASLTFDNPKSVVLYSNGGKVFSFASGSAAQPNSIGLTAELLNMWTNASPYASAGDFDDTPTRAVFKEEFADIQASITTTNNAMVAVSSNVVDGDSGYPLNKTTFNILNAKVLSMGRLNVSVDEINDSITAITGSTEPQAKLRVNFDSTNLTGTATTDGSFEIALADEIAPGTQIDFGTNWKFLTKWQQIESKGSVKITHLESLKFQTFVAPLHRSTVKRDDADWYVEITDTRLEDSGDWNLFVSLPQPLKILDEPLDSSVVLKQNRSQITLSPIPALVKTGEWQANPPTTTQISWSELEGILLTVLPEEEYAQGKYLSTMYWEILLSDE